MKKITLILCLIGLIAGCNKSPEQRTPQTPETITVLRWQEVEDICFKFHMTPWNGYMLADEKYSLPSEDWAVNKFPNLLHGFFQDLKNTRWMSEENDCDDFAKISSAFARLLHYNTKGHAKGTSLAFGDFYYHPDMGGGHVINWMIVRCKDGSNKVLFFDPQIYQFLKLSQTEIRSCDGLFL